MAVKHRSIPTLTAQDILRFWSKVDKAPGFGPNGDCWRWAGTALLPGYGTFKITDQNGVRMDARAHRISWAITKGPIPDGMCVLHSCDNPACCNPAHLWLGTNAENSADMVKKGRHPTGADHALTKLTDGDVIAIRQRYQAGGITQRSLAAQYGVNRGTIWRIIRRRRWVHLA